MPEPERGGIRVFGQGGIRVAEIRECLGAIEHAYNSVFVFRATIANWSEWSRRHGIPPDFYWDIAIPSRRGGLALTSWPPTREQIASLVPARKTLVLSAVRLESPGSWDLLGALNPLETLRQALQDAHERRKDHDYKEAAEAHRLDLENKLLEIKVIEATVELARKMGATDEQLAPYLNELVLRPLRQLLAYQDRGVIGGADILKLPPPKPKHPPDGKGSIDREA